MRLGYVILYVPHVAETVAFYEKAFGLSRRYIHESGQFAEMETGATSLAFCAEELIHTMDLAVRPTRPGETPPAAEVAFLTESVDKDYERALAAGAVSVLAPVTKPWGQTVSYVRDNNGFLVEICSPVSA